MAGGGDRYARQGASGKLSSTQDSRGGPGSFAETLQNQRRTIGEYQPVQANQQPPSVREDGYVDLARFLVRNCQLIVALWDGVSEQPTPDGSMAILPGGTADVVRMSEQGIKVNDDVLLTAPEKTPVEHLWTRRLKHAQRGNPIVKLELVASWASMRSSS